MAKANTQASKRIAKEHGISQAAARSGAVAVSLKAKGGRKKGGC